LNRKLCLKNNASNDPNLPFKEKENERGEGRIPTRWPMEGSIVWWPLKASNVWWPMERKGETPFHLFTFSPFPTFPSTNFT
jgi:hypothetical protein